MTRFTITAYVNVSDDSFLGWKPSHPVALVDRFQVEAADVHQAAEAMFTIGNRMDVDQDSRKWPSDVRSLSVGDLVEVRIERSSTFLACESVGWTDIYEPTNPVVPIEGTRATSREALS